jgi:hypothetical protein
MTVGTLSKTFVTPLRVLRLGVESVVFKGDDNP